MRERDNYECELQEEYGANNRSRQNRTTMTPREVDLQRRQSQLFSNLGYDIGNQQRQQPMQATAIMTQVSRTNFSEIGLKSLILVDVVNFIFEYKKISLRYSGHGLFMVDFMWKIHN